MQDRIAATECRPLRPAWLESGAGAGMFVFGIVMALLGAILPLISRRIQLDFAQSGNLFLVMNCAMLVSMLSLGLLTDRFGQKPVLAGGALCVALALALLMGASTYPAVLASAALLGIGGGALNGAANTLVSDLHRDQQRKASALNRLGVFFGFGALFLPFTIGALLERLGLWTILAFAVLLSLAPAGLFLALRFPPAKQSQGVPAAQVCRLARHPFVLLISFLLFFESGNEFILGGFTSTYLIRETGLSVGAASYLLAAYWGAIMITRLGISRLLLRVKGAAVVLAGAAVAAAAVALLLAARSAGIAAAAVILAGAGCSVIYPTTLSEAGGCFASYSGTVFGIIFAIALTGGISLPWAIGHAAAQWGLRRAMALAVINACAILILQIAVIRTARSIHLS